MLMHTHTYTANPIPEIAPQASRQPPVSLASYQPWQHPRGLQMLIDKARAGSAVDVASE